MAVVFALCNWNVYLEYGWGLCTTLNRLCTFAVCILPNICWRDPLQCDREKYHTHTWQKNTLHTDGNTFSRALCLVRFMLWHSILSAWLLACHPKKNRTICDMNEHANDGDNFYAINQFVCTLYTYARTQIYIYLFVCICASVRMQCQKHFHLNMNHRILCIVFYSLVALWHFVCDSNLVYDIVHMPSKCVVCFFRCCCYYYYFVVVAAAADLFFPFLAASLYSIM